MIRLKPIIFDLKHSSLFWFGVFLLLIEFAWQLLLPYQSIVEKADSTLRNPLVYRAWPEYLSNRPGQDDIVLIGNSQAVGLELPDARRTYASALEENAGALLQGRIFNWSVSGLNPVQMELLSLTALEQDPAALVLVVSLHNFSELTGDSIERDPSDLPLLLGDPRQVAVTLKLRSVAIATLDSLLIRASQWWSALLRSQTLVWDYLATVVPKSSHKFIFGHQREDDAMLKISNRAEVQVAAQVRPLQLRFDEAEWLRQFRARHLPRAQQFINQVLLHNADGKSKIVWIWMPFALRDDTLEIHSAMKIVHRDFCDSLHKPGLVCVDLTNAVDSGEFISGNLSSHFSAKGHQIMGQKMHEILRDAVYQR